MYLKFLSATLFSFSLVLWGCDRQQPQVQLSPSLSESFVSMSFQVEDESKPLSITERIYQQAGQDYPTPKISEVPLLSVQFVNYLSKRNAMIQLCGGETIKLLAFQYFPKIYSLGSQEYLVEQICDISTYNIRFGYLIYRPKQPFAKVEMKKFPQDAYKRTEKGYYFLQKNGLNQPELTVPEGEIIPLKFDYYSLDRSGKRVHRVIDFVAGKRLYEPNSRTLWVLGKGRGMGDCGNLSHYQLKNSQFVLLEERYQECCSTEQECNAPSYHSLPDEFPQIYP